MEATLTREAIDRGATKVPDEVTGEVFTPFAPGLRSRVMLLLSAEDIEAFDNLPEGPSRKTVTVTDLLVGDEFEVARASCGLGCYCAAEIVS